MPGEKLEVYDRIRASALVVGDVLVESCASEGSEGHDCEGVHERLVGLLIHDQDDLVLVITQDDAGQLGADIEWGSTGLRVLRPRPKREMKPLWTLTMLVAS